ncbi:hypothetical protein QZH41_014477, partial [Actinostola sp. cb2023]
MIQTGVTTGNPLYLMVFFLRFTMLPGNQDMMQCVIVFILLAASLSSATKCKKQVNSVFGYRLWYHVIGLSLESDMYECVQRCRDKKPKCYSINYKMADKMCELNSGSKMFYKQDFQEDQEFIHMDNPDKILSKQSCMDVKMASNPSVKSGYYSIAFGDQALMVYCDMENHGTFRLQIHGNPIYDVFYQIPSGEDKFNSSCNGPTNCPRIITSHVYPFQWESNCNGTKIGYSLSVNHY